MKKLFLIIFYFTIPSLTFGEEKNSPIMIESYRHHNFLLDFIVDRVELEKNNSLFSEIGSENILSIHEIHETALGYLTDHLMKTVIPNISSKYDKTDFKLVSASLEIDSKYCYWVIRYEIKGIGLNWIDVVLFTNGKLAPHKLTTIKKGGSP